MSTTITRPRPKVNEAKATLPGPDATATSATDDTAIVVGLPVLDATVPTFQEALASDDTAPPRASADEVASVQIACFDRAIGRARDLAFAENRTTVDIGADLQEAIDAFKPLIPKADWWRQRADTINDYETRFRLRMNGRTARAYAALNCYHVHRLASDDAKACVIDGRGGRPFPIATLETVGAWVVHCKADDSYAIRAGFEAHFDAVIGRVADEGLTADETAKAMDATESAVRLARAEANGGAKAKATEAKAQAAKAKADRSKAIDKATEAFAKALASDKIGGASASEVLHELSRRGLADSTGLVDPATMTPNDALAFSARLCELDRADAIFVMLTRFRAYEAGANAQARTAPAPRPSLDDRPVKAVA